MLHPINFGTCTNIVTTNGVGREVVGVNTFVLLLAFLEQTATSVILVK